MWVFANIGFYSIVQDIDQTDESRPVAIRARVRADLVTLRKAAEISGAIVEIPHRDYPYRVYASHEELGRVFGVFLRSINYFNFKDCVNALQGSIRASLYSRVWSVMYGAEEALEIPPVPPAPKPMPVPRKRAKG